MNFCPFCGKELTAQGTYCPYCGKQLIENHAVPVEDSNTADTQESVSATKSMTITKQKIGLSKKNLLLLLSVVLVIGIAAILLISPGKGNFADDPDAIQKAADSVVKLYMYDHNGIRVSFGSGFAALDKNIIITNYHCIEDDVYSIEAERADHSFFSIDSVVAYDKEKDIAILRAPESNLTPLDTGDSMNMKRGEKTVAIGSPIGFQQMVSNGIFSNYLGLDTHVEILSTASISNGSSGGALFDNHGKVVGITSGAYESGNDLYISKPIQYAIDLYDARTPEEEMTLAEFYEQSEHPYSADYLLAYGQTLNTQDITVQGYVSCIDHDIYLVSSPELVLYLDTRTASDLNTILEMSYKMREFQLEGFAIRLNTAKNKQLIDGILPGDSIEASGRMMYLGKNDIDIMVTTVEKLS